MFSVMESSKSVTLTKKMSAKILNFYAGLLMCSPHEFVEVQALVAEVF